MLVCIRLLRRVEAVGRKNMALGNYLQIDSIAQFAYSGDPEAPAGPDAIDCEKFTRIYLSGELPTQSIEYDLMKLGARTRRLISKARRLASRHGAFDVTIDHYTMEPKTRYLIRFGSSLATAPVVVASVVVKTK
jgi:hypothetical protein